MLTTEKDIKDNYSTITANMSILITHAEFEGEDHLVIPTILIGEGVLNDVLYTSEELAKFPDSWNGIPVPVLHPYSPTGKPISANRPDIIEKQTVGRLWNVYFEDQKLKGDVWINIRKLQEIDPNLYEMIQNGEEIDVSTGLYTEDEMISGEFKGKRYSSIAHNFRPDHLAILPNEKGAMSWEDGAGLCRVNKDLSPKEDIKTLQGKINKIVRILTQTCDKNIAYNEKDIQMEKTEIQELPKEKEELIEEVVEETTSESEEVVEVDSVEEVVASLEVDISENTEVVASLEETIPVEKEVVASLETNVAVEAKKELTVDEFVANAPEDIKFVLEEGLQLHKDLKDSLVNGLLTNKLNKFTEDELRIKTNEELTKISSLIAPIQDYSGQAGVHKINKAKPGVPPMPTMVWNEEGDK